MNIKYTRALYSFLAKRFFLALALFTAARLVFYIHNYHYFNHLPAWQAAGIFVKGIYFDISAAIILNMLFIILFTVPHPFKMNRYYSAAVEAAFFIPNVFGLILNLGDAGYFPFTLKRLTFDIVDYLNNDKTSVTMLPKFLLDFWPITLAGIIIIAAVIYLGRRIKFKWTDKPDYGFKQAAAESALFVITIIISVILFRGGLQLKPINIITAGEFTSAENVPLVLNTPFTMIKTINRKGLDRKDYYTQQELEKIFNPLHIPAAKAGQMRKMNVVLLIMESFSSEHSGRLNSKLEAGNYKGFTPFLDSLMDNSFVFTNAFANGKRSIEGIPAIVAGLPTLMEEAYITSNYAGDRITSLASLLKPEGYYTAFYHGGANGTMGFQSFTQMAGFENYFGKNEYPNAADFDGNWGIWDEPYFQYLANSLNSVKPPFLAAAFSLSSHHPYKVPAKYAGRFRKGKLEIQESIMYADYALQRFFKTASSLPWYKNTLFIITADHTSESALPFYQSRVGNFRVPILLFAPGLNLKGVNNAVVQQTDIMPTVMNLLNYDKPYLAFGNDMLDSSAARFAVTYLNGTYQLVLGPYALQYNGRECTGLFNMEEDSLLTKNIAISQPAIKNRLMSVLKAIIQQYNNRLIENKLVN